jgi:hypothetical protein
MSIGLLGLLDDVAAIAKVAAASLDDVAAQAAKAGAQASRQTQRFRSGWALMQRSGHNRAKAQAEFVENDLKPTNAKLLRRQARRRCLSRRCERL